MVQKKPAPQAPQAKAASPAVKAAGTAGKVVQTVVKQPAAPVRSANPITQTEKTMSKSSANANAPFFMMSAEEVSAIAKQNSDAFMRSMQTATTGVNQISQALAQFSQSMMQMSMAALQAASSARTLRDVAELQSDYAKTTMDTIVENSTKLTEMALKVANDASQPLSQRVNETMQQFSQRAA